MFDIEASEQRMFIGYPPPAMLGRRRSGSGASRYERPGAAASPPSTPSARKDLQTIPAHAPGRGKNVPPPRRRGDITPPVHGRKTTWESLNGAKRAFSPLPGHAPLAHAKRLVVAEPGGRLQTIYKQKKRKYPGNDGQNSLPSGKIAANQRQVGESGALGSATFGPKAAG